MIVATFRPTTGWAGRTISYEDGWYLLQDFGPVSARTVADYDAQGHLDWAYDGLREWVLAQAAPASAASGSAVPASAAPGSSALGSSPPTPAAGAAPPRRSRLPGWAIALIVLGVLLVLAVPVATFVPVFVSHSGQDNESTVKEGIRSIQVGIESWAVEHQGAYPDPALVSQAGLADFVSTWPVNPYTGAPMTQGTGPGDYDYVLAADGASYQLVGYGSGGAVITVP